jgi:hypothetical protein
LNIIIDNFRTGVKNIFTEKLSHSNTKQTIRGEGACIEVKSYFNAKSRGREQNISKFRNQGRRVMPYSVDPIRQFF